MNLIIPDVIGVFIIGVILLLFGISLIKNDHSYIGFVVSILGTIILIGSVVAIGSPRTPRTTKFELSEVMHSQYLVKRGSEYEFHTKDNNIVSVVKAHEDNVQITYEDGTPSVTVTELVINILGGIKITEDTTYVIQLPSLEKSGFK